LLSIGDYTIRTWGEAQAVRYLNALEASCQTLAGNPALGCACDNIRPSLRRMEHGRHVVFYRQVAGGILVSRILHQRMLPERID
jgi:toxin ParE1/3/4